MQPARNDEIGGSARPRGELTALFIPKHGFYASGMPRGMPLRYRLRTVWLELALRLRLCAKGFVRGLVHGTGVFGVGRLCASVLRADGSVEHYGLLSTKLVTNNGVDAFSDDWYNDGFDITTFNFHGCGTGVAAENQTDAALGTESTTALNPDNLRAVGTKSQPANGQCRSIGTVTFDAVAAITEHGLFSDVDVGQGLLLDRSVFSAINVASGDSIQFTYTLTLSAGG